MVHSIVASMIYIEQFRAGWPWSIGVLESWLSMSSSSSEVPASSILRIPSSRHFVPGCGRHPQEWSLQRTHLQRPLLKMSPTAGDKMSRGRNPENGRRRDFGRRWHWQSGFQHTDKPWPSSPELFNKDHNASRESLSHLIIRIVKSRRLRLAGHVTRMGNERGAWKLLVGKPEGKRPVGRPRMRWENNINHDLR